jgi:hypothetical protein
MPTWVACQTLMLQPEQRQRLHGSFNEGRGNSLQTSVIGGRHLDKGEIHVVLVCACDRVSFVLIRDPSFLSCILFEVVQLVHSRITRPGTKLLGRAKSVSLEKLLLIGKTEWPVRAHLVNFHPFVEKCRIF